MQIKIGNYLESHINKGFAVRIKRINGDVLTVDWYKKDPSGRWSSMQIEQEIIVNETFEYEWKKLNL